MQNSTMPAIRLFIRSELVLAAMWQLEHFGWLFGGFLLGRVKRAYILYENLISRSGCIPVSQIHPSNPY